MCSNNPVLAGTAADAASPCFARIVVLSARECHDSAESTVRDSRLQDHAPHWSGRHGDGVSGRAAVAVAAGRDQGARQRTHAERRCGAPFRARGPHDRAARSSAYRQHLRRRSHLGRPDLLHDAVPAERRSVHAQPAKRSAARAGRHAGACRRARLRPRPRHRASRCEAGERAVRQARPARCWPTSASRSAPRTSRA